MGMSEEIRVALETAFKPDVLEIVDESESHRGHAGFREGGESHYKVTIRAGLFAPMTRIERHRAVHRALGEPIVGRIHALALDVA